ncbi:hypothetical protein [Reyranella sp.]|uniref:hypothetical protein n=1 Tax=Reyranella sp. TaxID=1929291 RepID=UPI003D09B200
MSLASGDNEELASDTDPAIQASVDRSKDFLLAQTSPRSAHRSSLLVPDDPTINRTSAGEWSGTFTLPSARPSAPYTPVFLTGPRFFPLLANHPATFMGLVDAPFGSMGGWAGIRSAKGAAIGGFPANDPGTVFADGGINWGSFFVVGSVDDVTQFIAPVSFTRAWSATVEVPPQGKWSFQLVTYANACDAAADSRRIPVGFPWREADRPGDVRDHDVLAYEERAPLFVGIALDSESRTITGTLGNFTRDPSRSYRILVTSESEIEEAWALEPAEPGPFEICRPHPFGGRIRLRLVERVDGCPVRVVGQVWAEENAVLRSAYPDLRVEYRAITSTIPFCPTSTTPADRDGTWRATLVPGAIGRVSLVDLNTLRVYGECTMPSGLLRSYNVPATGMGQSLRDVYHDGFNDCCFLYDQAVALIAFLQLGERKAAADLVAALRAVQNPDGGFPFATDQAAILARGKAFTRTGAVAWVCYSLLLADQPRFRGWFADRTDAAAQACLDYLLTFRNGLGLMNGGAGIHVDRVLDPDRVVPWWSTEHNINTWWCLDLAATQYGIDRYRVAADALKDALETHAWNPSSRAFWQGGTYTAGGNVPDGQHALDMMSWGGILLDRWGRRSDAAATIARMFRHYLVTDGRTGLSGFTTFVPLDGYPQDTVLTPWYEGSFGAVCAIRSQDPASANRLMAALAVGQNADGSYPYALARDPINDINTFPCLIGAAWNILAYAGPGTPHAQVLWRQ